jgi:hypothetical protein
LGGQPNHFACEGTSHLLGTSSIGQMHEYKITTGPFNKRRDGGFPSFANDQIALPMPWDSPVDRLSGTVTNHHHVGQSTLQIGSSVRTPPGATCS